MLGSLAAAAQPLPSVESVVVTGTKSPQALSDFVGEVGRPTRLIGKLARWEVPVCLRVMGVNDSAAQFLSKRIAEVAVGAGARVNRDPKCRANVRIVFTTTPQALVSDIRETKMDLLGYYDSVAELDQIATFQHPIQAWYVTATRDARGQLQTDTARTEGIEIPIPGTGMKHWMPNARVYAVTGSRLGDGLRANLHHVTIIADPTRLLDQEMGPVADYMAMMALSQMQSLDRCQSLPSITNLLVAECPRIPGGLSDIDLGYLRGLYHLDAERAKGVQLHQIIYQMRREVLKGE
jgi:hypothetical protein